MATVGKTLADKIIANNGYYADDPRVARVIEYTNMAGVQDFAIEYPHERGRYRESEFARNPKVIWEAK